MLDVAEGATGATIAAIHLQKGACWHNNPRSPSLTDKTRSVSVSHRVLRKKISTS